MYKPLHKKSAVYKILEELLSDITDVVRGIPCPIVGYRPGDPSYTNIRKEMAVDAAEEKINELFKNNVNNLSSESKESS